jgi:antitoxin component YwqK of YwqJK toxin-antitoxin module
MTNELKRPEIIRVNEENLQDVGHGKYTGAEYWHENKPFTGFVVIEYHANGNIFAEKEYVNGQKMGWEVEYHENGKIQHEGLEYGATSVFFREFDTEGNKTTEAWIAPKQLYNMVALETGIPIIEEYGYLSDIEK